MERLLSFMENAVITRMTAHAPLQKGALGQGFTALAMALGVISAAFFAYAGFIWIRQTYPPIEAALLAGGVAVFLSLLVLLVTYIQARIKKAQFLKLQTAMTDDIQAFLRSAKDECDLYEPVQENPKTAVFLAALVGYILADKAL